MSDLNSDILQEISTDDLEKLADKYKHYKEVPYVYSFLRTAIQWKQLGENELTKVYSPDQQHLEHGTFIALMEVFKEFNLCSILTLLFQFGNYDIFCYTLEKSQETLLKALVTSKRINWTQPVLFFNLSQRLYDTILKVVKELDLTVSFNNRHKVYSLLKGVKFEVQLPEEVELKELDDHWASVIDSLYKARRHRYPNGEQLIKTLIKVNQGFGIFASIEGKEQLLSWVMRTCLGQIGFLQTVEGFGRKGFATNLVKAVSNKITELGFQPQASVFVTNKASMQLFEKLGFEIIEECYFIEVVRNNS